jgi:inner membrane transporter RhtA
LLFVLGAVSQYLGAAIAVSLFPAVPAASVAWARVLVGAVAMLAWRRPWRVGWTRRRLLLAVVFGLVLAGMNIAFYLAVARLPLGTAVAIEFSGPVAVATLGARRPRDLVAVGLAVGGVLLLAGVSWSAAPAGVGWALAAAALWAGYIVLGARVSMAGAELAGAEPAGATGVDSLAIGLAAGAVVFAPVLAAGAAPALHSPALAAACIGVGLLSTAVPYGIDQVVLRRLPAAVFALLQSLLPATAAAVGAVVLRQLPNPAELVGITAVVAAVAMRAGRAGRAAPE